jgi:hypothetical protein
MTDLIFKNIAIMDNRSCRACIALVTREKYMFQNDVRVPIARAMASIFVAYPLHDNSRAFR